MPNLSTIAYLDCFAGISGDMLLGALIDAGWPLERLNLVVERLGLAAQGVRITHERVTRQSISGAKIDVIIPTPDDPHTHHHRNRDDLVTIIANADLPETVRTRAIAVVDALAAAESRVHGVPVEQVHFHEIGSVDTLVDVVGGICGLHELGIERLYCSPLPWTRGSINTQHGGMPVPPPAVSVLVEGLPVVGVDLEGEMVTPTGAAMSRTLCAGFGIIPDMRVTRVGYGSGTRTWPDRPNLLRLVIGEAAVMPTGLYAPQLPPAPGLATETLNMLACNLDDMNPQWYGPLVEMLLAAGALDVWLSPVHMKKNRPGTVVEVLCSTPTAPMVRDILLRHTTTLGVREQLVTRHCVDREVQTVQTRYGEVRVKFGILPNGPRKAAPEHDDCVARAAEHNVSIREVWLAALDAAEEKSS